jgi:hypothetical protein
LNKLEVDENQEVGYFRKHEEFSGKFRWVLDVKKGTG